MRDLVRVAEIAGIVPIQASRVADLLREIAYLCGRAREPGDRISRLRQFPGERLAKTCRHAGNDRDVLLVVLICHDVCPGRSRIKPWRLAARTRAHATH